MKFLCLLWLHLSTVRKKTCQHVLPSDSCKLSKEEKGEECDFMTEVSEEYSKCDVIPWMFSACDVKNIQWNRLSSTDFLQLSSTNIYKNLLINHNATLKFMLVSLHVEGVVCYFVFICTKV